MNISCGNPQRDVPVPESAEHRFLRSLPDSGFPGTGEHGQQKLEGAGGTSIMAARQESSIISQMQDGSIGQSNMVFDIARLDSVLSSLYNAFFPGSL